MIAMKWVEWWCEGSGTLIDAIRGKASPPKPQLQERCTASSGAEPCRRVDTHCCYPFSCVAHSSPYLPPNTPTPTRNSASARAAHPPAP